MTQIVKHAGGRPTKYIPEEILPKIEEYLTTTGREQTELPSYEGLALYLGVVPDTIQEWYPKYPEFSVSLKKILMYQKKQLMDDGMYGGKDVNAAMAIFLLKVNHGMHETPSHLTQVNIGGDVSVEFIEDVQSNLTQDSIPGSNGQT